MKPPMRALKGAGIILAGIVGAVAFVFLLAVYILGLLWVSTNVFDYLNAAAVIAVAVCLFVLLPLALFRVTRKFSVYGLYISSVIFGVSTWILGFLVTFQHWGAIGVFVGVIMGIVGVVPLGILASAVHADWPQVGDLALGLVVTFGARMVAVMLATWMDRDEAGINSNSTSESTAPINRSPISYAAEKRRTSLRFDPVKRLQIILTALGVFILCGLAVRGIFDPSRHDYQQAMVNFQHHPIASISGALLPAIMLSPLAYWMFGWILRRNAARFKICEHCAETIKAEAKVCRYCGRDVAPASRMAVEARQQAADEQRRPGDAANPVRAVAASAAISATNRAQSRNPWQQSRPALVAACALALVAFGSIGWFARQAQAPKYEGQDFDTLTAKYEGPWTEYQRSDKIPRFDELPSAPIKAGPYEDAAAAHNRGDYAAALRLFHPLADQGNSAAQNRLGSMYSNGEGVPQDDAEAVKWLRRAADRGNTPAQNNLGIAYWNGRGVKRNDAEAVRWFRLAADQGFVDAQANLGHMYFAGPVELQSDAEAVKWFRLAASQGDAPAQYFLGFMYFNGRGVPKNNVDAYIWLNRAAAQGDRIVGDVAVKFRDLVEQSLTTVQLAEATRFAQERKSKSTSRGDLLSDADVGLLSDVPAPKQSAQGGTPQHSRDLAPWGSLPDAPQPRRR
jgi:uncharacterized protein